MKFDNASVEEVWQYFPKLKIVDGNICGEIEFFSKYTQNHRGQWVIESCEPEQEDCLHGRYNIKIVPNELRVPRVYEMGGKIKSFAKKIGMQLIDLHVNRDDSCCLDFPLNIHPMLSPKEFILSKVYSFFVWQAYYEKFHIPPPVGEYSHGKKEAIQEFLKDLTSLKRNDSCTCGSGKKFKKCCMKILNKNHQ